MKKYTKSLAIAFLILGSQLSAYAHKAAPLKESVRQQHAVNQHLSQLLKQAKMGRKEALLELGDIFKLTPQLKDMDKAIFWYKKAKEAGVSEAQSRLDELSKGQDAK